MLMLTLHPVIQVAITLLAIYVLVLGVARFRRLHLQQKILFQWQRHALLGSVVLLLLLFGILFGLVMVKVAWNGLLITGGHGKRSIIMLPLILLGLASGLYMHKRKKQRVMLPLIHGSVNVLLIVFMLLQGFSGWQVYNGYVLGN